MKTVLSLLITICSLAGAALGQKPTDDPLRSLVAAERAFAHASEAEGTRPSFMAFIADDGILFRPTAVKGKAWMQANPVELSPTRSLLSWRPIYADVSRAGDLGYTTGPWEFKQNIKDAKAVAWGNYMTVWKKQPDGAWKFVLDLGISNPEPKPPAASWEPPNRLATRSAKVDVNAARASLLERERRFLRGARSLGSRRAFLLFAATDVRLFREDHPVFIGRLAATQALVNEAAWSWIPAFADVSASGDLGYSYGTYELTNKSGAITESGNYARVWKKLDGAWRVVIDVANPIPKKN